MQTHSSIKDRFKNYKPGDYVADDSDKNLLLKYNYANLNLAMFGYFGVGKSALGNTIISYCHGRYTDYYLTAANEGSSKTRTVNKQNIGPRTTITDLRGAPDASAKVLQVLSRQARGLFENEQEIEWKEDDWYERLQQSKRDDINRITCPIFVHNADSTLEIDDVAPIVAHLQKLLCRDPIIVMTKPDFVSDIKAKKMALAKALNINEQNIFAISCWTSRRRYMELKDDKTNNLEIELLLEECMNQTDLVLLAEAKGKGCTIL